MQRGESFRKGFDSLWLDNGSPVAATTMKSDFENLHDQISGGNLEFPGGIHPGYMPRINSVHITGNHMLNLPSITLISVCNTSSGLQNLPTLTLVTLYLCIKLNVAANSKSQV